MGVIRVNRKVREAMVAGIFYSDDEVLLEKTIEDSLATARKTMYETNHIRPNAILSPHAAFDYSGIIQAAAWAQVDEPVDRVLILAPFRQNGESAAYLPESEIFQTPLGDVHVDAEVCSELESCNTLFATNDIPHLECHAIEVQLPFMRRLFPEALLVPILVCGDARVVSALARAIDLVLGEAMDTTLVVASSNLASSLVSKIAERSSEDLLASIYSGDWRNVSATHNSGGSAAIASTMALGNVEGSRFRLLSRIDSTHHKAPINEKIVHYCAGIWFKENAS